MKKSIFLSAIGYLALLGLLLVLVTNADAADVTFSASLKSYGAAPVYVNLVLTNCGQDAFGRSNIPMTSSGVHAKLDYQITPDTSGLATALVTPDADITCGNVAGGTRYRVEIRLRAKNVADPQHDPLLSANEFVIGPSDFTLTSAQPAVSPAPPAPGIDFTLYRVTRPFRMLPFASFRQRARQTRTASSDRTRMLPDKWITSATPQGMDLIWWVVRAAMAEARCT
jgi:hypothetical protein